MATQEHIEKLYNGFPCVFFSKLDSDRPELNYPQVDCEKQCDTCGWNPKVKKVRLAKMGYKRNA